MLPQISLSNSYEWLYIFLLLVYWVWDKKKFLFIRYGRVFYRTICIYIIYLWGWHILAICGFVAYQLSLLFGFNICVRVFFFDKYIFSFFLSNKFDLFYPLVCWFKLSIPASLHYQFNHSYLLMFIFSEVVRFIMIVPSVSFTNPCFCMWYILVDYVSLDSLSVSNINYVLVFAVKLFVLNIPMYIAIDAFYFVAVEVVRSK